MSIHLSVRIDHHKAVLHLARVSKATEHLNPFGAQTVARVALDQIKRRTALGLDQSEKPFQAYRERHKRARGKRGLSTRLVNLNFEGDMLRSLRAETRRPKGIPQPALAFHDTSERKKAMAHQKGGGKMPIREFLGFKRGTRSHNAVKRAAIAAFRRQIKAAKH